MIGWNLFLRYGVNAAILSRGASDYLARILEACGIYLPPWLISCQWGPLKNLQPIAPIFMAILAFIESRGVRNQNIFNILLTSSKLITLSVIIIIGFLNFKSENMKPFIKEDEGIEGTIFATTLLVYSYLGFDFITTISEEARDNKRELPKSVSHTAIIVTLIYTLVSLSLCGIGLGLAQNYSPNTGFADAFNDIGCTSVAIIIYFCAFFGMSAACFTCYMANPRLIIAYAQQGLLPYSLSQVNHRNVSWKASLVSAVTSCLVGLVFEFEFIARLLSLSNLIGFSYVTVVGISFRYQSNKRATYLLYVVILMAILTAVLFNFSSISLSGAGLLAALSMLAIL